MKSPRLLEVKVLRGHDVVRATDRHPHVGEFAYQTPELDGLERLAAVAVVDPNRSLAVHVVGLDLMIAADEVPPPSRSNLLEIRTSQDVDQQGEVFLNELTPRYAGQGPERVGGR